MAKRKSRFKIRQLWWRKTTRNHLERLKKVGSWHPLPRLTLKQWQERWEQFDHRCAYCFKKFNDIRDVWIEHLIGISDGGTHRFGNVVPACPQCNQKKGNKSLEEFIGLTPDVFVKHQLEKLAIHKLQEQEQEIEYE